MKPFFFITSLFLVFIVLDIMAQPSNRHLEKAYKSYTSNNLKKASVEFELAYNDLGDVEYLYNAAYSAQKCGQTDRARVLLQKCVDNQYYADGEVFAILAEVDTLNTKKYLEEGFFAFPLNQSILIGLINYYLTNDRGINRLFELLEMAKVNEPDNPSLYYVEGNIHGQLGEIEQAVASYRKCAELDPNYEYGYIGEGVLFYNLAIEVQTKAQEEKDDNKFEGLVAKFEKNLKACIEPFEKAYKVSKDNGIRVNIAEYLKNAFYHFRDQDPSYQAGYDKYNKICLSGKAK